VTKFWDYIWLDIEFKCGWSSRSDLIWLKFETYVGALFWSFFRLNVSRL